MPCFTIDLSDEIDGRLSQIAKANGITKAEAMQRAFALLAVAEETKGMPGQSLGIVKQTDNHLEAIGRIVGL
jgi:predicted transcriptional regulator